MMKKKCFVKEKPEKRKQFESGHEAGPNGSGINEGAVCWACVYAEPFGSLDMAFSHGR